MGEKGIARFAGGSGEETTNLYRVMSEAEYDSLMSNKKFVPYDRAMEEKWFATTQGDAIKWASQIDWISYEEGGRKKIPSEGVRYCPLIRINGAIGYDEWSIDFICPDFKETNLIKFQFLVDDAPCDLLEENMSYNIYEGNRKVAELKIIKCNGGE